MDTLYILTYHRSTKTQRMHMYVERAHRRRLQGRIVQAQAELPVFVPLICFADYRRSYN